MANLLELYRMGKEKVPPDKALVIAAITALSTYLLIPIQTACTFLIHELEKDQPDESVRILAIAIIGLSTLLSVASEIPTLHKRGYSASITSSAAQMLVGKSVVKSSAISLASHAITGPMLIGLSPGNFLALFAQDWGRLGFENAAGVIAGVTLWRVFFNTLINAVDSKKLFEPAQNLYYRLKPDAYLPMRDINKLQ